MRHLVFLGCTAILLGCAKSGDQPARDTTAAAPATPAPPATLSLADVAGTWNVRATTEAGDSVVGYQLTATADTAGWTFLFPGRKPIPMRVVLVDGDSIVTEAGPFESALRKGVQVRTRNVNRLQDGKLVSMTEARYVTTGPDSLLHLRGEGSRAP